MGASYENDSIPLAAMPRKSPEVWWALSGVFVAVGILAAIAIGLDLTTGTRHDLRLCDDAIEATLKAPATYKRIEARGSDGLYSMTYDASNSFGVPLRSTGFCSVEKDQKSASWLEMPIPHKSSSD